jgi:membrane protease YdiL (CAAX protease family)
VDCRRHSPNLWLVFAAFSVLWLILDRSAAGLGSYRGEFGVVVCLVVLMAALAVEVPISRNSVGQALLQLGLKPPAAKGMTWSMLLCAGMLLFYPSYAFATGTTLRLRPDWLLLLPGLFAQGGIAEETVFRGFLFRHVRNGRSFWRAALLSSVPFIAVHLLLFFSMDWPIALAALLVALSISYPLARLFERSGNSIWPCALVHFVVQGSIKLVDVPDDQLRPMAIAWMVISASAPWLSFLVLRPYAEEHSP